MAVYPCPPGCLSAMAPEFPLVLRISSCRGLAYILPRLDLASTPDEHARALLTSTLTQLAPLFRLTTAETVHLVAETLTRLMQNGRKLFTTNAQLPSHDPASLGQQQLSQSLSALISLQLFDMVLKQIWGRFPSDSVIVTEGTDTLKALLDSSTVSPTALGAVIYHTLHHLAGAFATSSTHGFVVRAALEVLEAAVRKAHATNIPSIPPHPDTPTFPAAAVVKAELGCVFPSLVHFLASAEDADILSEGVSFLRVCVRYCPLQDMPVAIAQQGGATTTVTCLDLLVNFLSNFFGREDEGAVRTVGVLIAEVITYQGNALQEKVVESMLAAVLQRLDRATSRELVQQLILVFVRLALVNVEAVVSFLNRHQVMDRFLQSWLDVHSRLGTMHLAKVRDFTDTCLFQ